MRQSVRGWVSPAPRRTGTHRKETLRVGDTVRLVHAHGLCSPAESVQTYTIEHIDPLGSVTIYNEHGSRQQWAPQFLKRTEDTAF